MSYVMTNHLSEASKVILLEFYNWISEGGKFPQRWKEAGIIQIGKSLSFSIMTNAIFGGKRLGADRMSLRAIYIGLIRSLLDYGCIVYNSSAETTLRNLDIVQYQALRFCTGEIKSTPTVSIQVKMGEMHDDIT